MNTSRDMTLEEFMSIIEESKEKHEKRTGENICVELTCKTSKFGPVLYLEVRNHKTNMNCKKGMFLDDFVKNEDPRHMLLKILFNTIVETSDWYICNGVEEWRR